MTVPNETKPAWTPGPWRAARELLPPYVNDLGDPPYYSHYSIYDADETELASVHYADGRAKANARLIAAAPKVAEALRALVTVYDRVGGPLVVDPAVADARAILEEVGA